MYNKTDTTVTVYAEREREREREERAVLGEMGAFVRSSDGLD